MTRSARITAYIEPFSIKPPEEPTGYEHIWDAPGYSEWKEYSETISSFISDFLPYADTRYNETLKKKTST